jgi:DNA-binding transcriptional MerR regulator
MIEGIMEEDKLISYDDIIEYGKKLGIEITWRKLNYYKTLGLLPKPLRQERKGFYSYAIAHVLVIYNFLQNHLGLTLEEIKQMIGEVSKGNPLVAGQIQLFALWVDSTYGFFLEMARDKIGKTYPFAENGVLDITDINLWYKKSLQESNLLKLSSGDNPLEAAKKWAKEAVKKYVPNIPGKE